MFINVFPDSWLWRHSLICHRQCWTALSARITSQRQIQIYFHCIMNDLQKTFVRNLLSLVSQNKGSVAQFDSTWSYHMEGEFPIHYSFFIMVDLWNYLLWFRIYINISSVYCKHQCMEPLFNWNTSRRWQSMQNICVLCIIFIYLSINI